MPITRFTQSVFTLPDGSEYRSYFDLPAGEQPCPLVLILGGGPGDARIASSAFRIHGEALIDRGWAVAAPVSGTEGEKVWQLIEAIRNSTDVDDSPVLLLGISNGGISALEMAAMHPGDFRGIIALPAIVPDTVALSDLAGVPVYLRIGSDDPLGWGECFDKTVARLTDAGADLDARLLTGVKHTVQPDWDEIDAWLLRGQ
jgi:pimeloyl-ACP methyl ester carboxylesterase